MATSQEAPADRDELQAEISQANSCAPSAGDSVKLQDREGKYLTFSLSEEEYGIGILKIKEIIGMMAITSVPQTPAFVKGVINLRGKVIPVVDLRLRFGMPKEAIKKGGVDRVVPLTGITRTALEMVCMPG